MNMKRKAFTLIELLLVIAILGILAVVILQQFNNTEEKAKSTVNQYNASLLVRQLATYRAANGNVFPSRLHNGLKTNTSGETTAELMNGMPNILVQNFAQDNIWDINSNQFTTGLKKHGMAEFQYGEDSEMTFSPPGALIRIKGDFYTGFRGNGSTKDNFAPEKIVKFDGMTLKELTEAAPMLKDGAGVDNTEMFFVGLVFLGPQTQWGAVFGSDGKYKSSSKVSISEMKNIYKDSTITFDYPLIFLKIFKSRPPELIGVLTVGSGGGSLINPTKQ